MKFTFVSIVAFLSASAYAAAAAPVEARLKPRAGIDGCPDSAPWPMGSPGNYWYPICCPYVLADPGCCNRHPENGIAYGDKPYPPCPKPSV